MEEYLIQEQQTLDMMDGMMELGLIRLVEWAGHNIYAWLLFARWEW